MTIDTYIPLLEHPQSPEYRCQLILAKHLGALLGTTSRTKHGATWGGGAGRGEERHPDTCRQTRHKQAHTCLSNTPCSSSTLKSPLLHTRTCAELTLVVHVWLLLCPLLPRHLDHQLVQHQLASGPLKNVLLNAAASHKAIDVDRLGLADAVRTRHGLRGR